MSASSIAARSLLALAQTKKPLCRLIYVGWDEIYFLQYKIICIILKVTIILYKRSELKVTKVKLMLQNNLEMLKVEYQINTIENIVQLFTA